MSRLHVVITWVLVHWFPSYDRYLRQCVSDAYLQGREQGEALGAARGYILAKNHMRRVVESRYKWFPSNEHDVP